MEKQIPALPRRRAYLPEIRKEFSYRQIIADDISFNLIAAITIGKEDLNYNLDKLKKIIEGDKRIQLKFLDWESVKYIDSNFNTRIDNDCFLVDDGLRISREYIDLTCLKSINLIMPITYLMWGVSFRKEVKIYCLKVFNEQGGFTNLSSNNGNEKISSVDLMKIQEKILELSHIGAKTDQEKVLAISDFIQSRTQFIEGYESESNHGIFITPDIPRNYSEAAYIETVLNKNHGKCVGISNLSTLLLNNPEFNVEVETVFGSEHAWNRVLIDGMYYYFDNTWNITRTDDPNDAGLITMSFSNKYNLFGTITAGNIGHHSPYSIPFYSNGVVSETDYGTVNYQSKFEYPNKPLIKSYKKL